MKLLLPLVMLFSLMRADPEVRVNIPTLGTLEGVKGSTYLTKRTIYEFMGIPFAEPPIGQSRFMRPTKKAPWQGVLNATQYGEVCHQLVLPHGSEDCLSLNVHSPQIHNNSKLPVLFYIHGGSFIEGTSRNIKPVFLLEHDLVLVAPQYRLGPLGFLTLATTNKTGNAAMYDILMALHWVRDHIHHFGGDPDRITVGGISAGAGIAALFYVSPLTQDIIKQVALFSGSALALWALDPEPIVHSWYIAEELGCYNESDDDVLSCLQTIENPLDMTRAYDKISEAGRRRGIHGMGGTVPILDDEILIDHPEMILKSDQFAGRPMLMSVTRDEGIFLLDTLLDSYLKTRNLNLSSPHLRENIAEILMSYTELHDPTWYTAVTAINENYFPEGRGLRQGIIDFLGTAYFKGPGLKMAELNAMKNNKTFVSTFNYDPQGMGVDHASEQRYIFPRNLTGFTNSDLEVVKKLTKLFANFIIKGTPTDELHKVDQLIWEPLSPPQENYLVVDSMCSLRQDFKQEFAPRTTEKRSVVPSSAHRVLGQYLLGSILLSIIVLFMGSV